MRASCARVTTAPSSTRGVALNLAQAVAFALAVAATAALFAFMRFSYTGKLMRATAQDRSAAPAHGNRHGPHLRAHLGGRHCLRRCGRRVARADLPGLPHGGLLQFVLIAYIAVVLGGLGDMVGALIAALIVAAVEVVGSYTIGTSWKEVLYLLFIAILVVRPAGLFGQRGSESLGM